MSDRDHQQLVVQNAARFAELERKRLAGELSFETETLERNKINAALMTVIERLPERTGHRRIWAAGLALLVLAATAFFVLKAKHPAKETPVQSVQPAVHQPARDTAPVVVPPEQQKTAAPKKKAADTRNHFESKDQSKQINAPDNQGTININQ